MDDQALSARIGEATRTLRRARGLTLQDLSARSGLTISRLSRIELGEREITVGALVRLARALGVSVNDLLGEPALNDPVAALTRAVPDDPEELRRRLVTALRALAGS